MPAALLRHTGPLPRPADPERAAIGLQHWIGAAEHADDPALLDFARRQLEPGPGRALLEAVFGNSPYLGQLLCRDLGSTRLLFDEGADAAIAASHAGLAGATAAPDVATLMAALRQAKGKAALAVALADIVGAWPLETVMAQLSRTAELALEAAVSTLLRGLDRKGELVLPHPEEPQRASGFVVLALGKLGARELNFSSDIDLIVLYDPARIPPLKSGEPRRLFVRLTRDLVRAMEERTADGYVFRCDLRLRPDPGATPLALSTLAAETYYETAGQNWERAAMIKARPVAGDLVSGHNFLRALKPYLWRKHLDFAAIEDIHSIKRQIVAHRGGAAIAVEGHNVKLGRGGIREIEFFVQTQQLIWGGREPTLRVPGTVAGLTALTDAGRIDRAAAEQLTAAYRYLRRVEHRLQMVDDQQTHTLPATAEGVAAFAAFLGYSDPDQFRKDLLGHLGIVAGHFARLFEEARPLGGPGSLVFTGTEHDPETLRTLERLGFPDAGAVSATIQNWHRGRYRAMRSARARELLTELTPRLLEAMSRTPEPDQAFHCFDAFLGALPAGVQLFSLFVANPALLDLLAEIMGSAPRLAETLARNPGLLDAVLDHDFFAPPPDASGFTRDLAARLEQAGDMQDVLDLARRFANEARFRVGVLNLRRLLSAEAAGAALSDLADALFAALVPRVADEFTRTHGRCAGAGFAVIALGKYGGRELTAGSDLDLVFLYDVPAGATGLSDGPRPLSAMHYYQRFAQRLISAFASQTGEGRLSEIDMRLRPQGNAGPLAASLAAFREYYSKEAWTWEHLALTRARVVHGEAWLGRRIEEAIRSVLTVRRDRAALVAAVAEMRRKIEAEHGTKSPWRIKYFRGGLIDCEFIAQTLQLMHAHDHPEVLDPSTSGAIRRLGAAGLLPAETAAELIAATRLWLNLQAWLRLAAARDDDEEAWSPALAAALARVGEAADFAALKAKVLAVAGRVRHHYEQMLDGPAARAATAAGN